MRYKYINPFHSAYYQDSKPIIETEEEPIEHQGYKIFKRIEVHRKITDTMQSVFVSDVYDIVKPGDLLRPSKCVGMNAGLNGAKRRIETNQPPLHL